MDVSSLSPSHHSSPPGLPGWFSRRDRVFFFFRDCDFYSSEKLFFFYQETIFLFSQVSISRQEIRTRQVGASSPVSLNIGQKEGSIPLEMILHLTR